MKGIKKRLERAKKGQPPKTKWQKKLGTEDEGKFPTSQRSKVGPRTKGRSRKRSAGTNESRTMPRVLAKESRGGEEKSSPQIAWLPRTPSQTTRSPDLFAEIQVIRSGQKRNVTYWNSRSTRRGWCSTSKTTTRVQRKERRASTSYPERGRGETYTSAEPTI